MTNYFDDDSPIWEEPSGEATAQIERVRGRTPERTRTHHVVARDSTPSGRLDRDDAEMMWLEPRSRADGRLGGFGSVDPRLLSIGALAIAAVLAVPLFGAFGDDGGESSMRSITEAEAEPTTTTAAPDTTLPLTPVIVVTAAVDPDQSGSLDPDAGRGGEADTGESDSGSDSTGGTESGAPDDGSAGAEAAARQAPADCSNSYSAVAGDYWLRIADSSDVSLDSLLELNAASAETPIYPGSDVCLPAGVVVDAPASSGPDATAAAMSGGAPAMTCAQTYETAAGDYWLRIADASETPLDELLALNEATTDTPIYPGSDICLPASATNPTPPATTQPATTQSPTTEAPTTQPPTTEPPTTQPATTEPESTTPPTPAPSGGEVEQIIRDVWPDELEEQALRIAWRESNYVPTARNYCCHGLFQMHWEAHNGWLTELGISSIDQLYDARTNVEAAYTLYQRSGGWGPWAQTAD